MELVQTLFEWRGPAGEWVDIGAARAEEKRTDILLLCDEEASVRAGWSLLRRTWVGAVTRGVAARKAREGVHLADS